MLIIGERINPTGKRRLAEDLARGRFAVLLEEAKCQLAAGAQALDVNVCVEGRDEAELMLAALRELRAVTDSPIFVDSRSHAVHCKAIEAGGENLVVNSAREGQDPDVLLALAAKRSAGAVLMPLGGPTGDFALRKRAASSLVQSARQAGLDESRLWVDVGVVPLALGASRLEETIQFLRFVRDELGARTLAAISNGSFGLTSRAERNRELLERFVAEGVDAVIVDPTQRGLLDILQQGV